MNRPAAILTDIEGTTSSIAFVHEVMFPYSRSRLRDFALAHGATVAPLLDQVRAEAGAPALDDAACLDLLEQWHDADRKIGPLKTLQGLIWDEGFASGQLRGHVYPDAAAGLRRWHAAGIPLYIYSSGSVAAQKLLFGHSDHGDLTPLFSGHFDTAVGAKRETASYVAIAAAIGLKPGAILFLSDVEQELEAASQAGMMVTHLAREGLRPSEAFPAASDFAAILPEEALA